MSRTTIEPPAPLRTRLRAPHATLRLRPAPPAPAPDRGERTRAFWRALRATLEGIAHR